MNKPMLGANIQDALSRWTQAWSGASHATPGPNSDTSSAITNSRQARYRSLMIAARDASPTTQPWSTIRNPTPHRQPCMSSLRVRCGRGGCRESALMRVHGRRFPRPACSGAPGSCSAAGRAHLLRRRARGGMQRAAAPCESQFLVAAGSSPRQEPQNMALSQSGDLRIRAVVAVEGRTRLVPLT